MWVWAECGGWCDYLGSFVSIVAWQEEYLIISIQRSPQWQIENIKEEKWKKFRSSSTKYGRQESGVEYALYQLLEKRQGFTVALATQGLCLSFPPYVGPSVRPSQLSHYTSTNTITNTNKNDCERHTGPVLHHRQVFLSQLWYFDRARQDNKTRQQQDNKAMTIACLPLISTI